MSGYYLGREVLILHRLDDWLVCKWPDRDKPCLHWPDQVKAEPWGDMAVAA